MQRTCPKCGLGTSTNDAECPRCGVVFAKFEEVQSTDIPPAAVVVEDPEPAVRPLTRDARRATVIGFALAVIVSLLPLLRFVFGYFGVLVHELGHTVCAWVFGYPAIPAFNFQHGGGVTSIEDRKLLLMLVIYAGLAYAIHRYRQHVPGLIALLCLTTLYSLAAFTNLHRLLISFMGHGFELLFVGIFLYRALSGSGVKIAVERPLYAFVAFFLVFWEIGFAFGLATNHEKRVEYELALSGIPGDLTEIAGHLNTSLATVGAFYLFLTVLSVAFSFLYYRYREPVMRRICWLLNVQRETVLPEINSA